jgi:RimJ/RimL family protein N-acetyltransferase
MALRAIEISGQAPEWWRDLPPLRGERVSLRELQPDDASALFHTVRIPEVSRQMWPPPSTLDAVHRFIARARAKRAEAQYICYGVVPEGWPDIAGLFELRPLQPNFFRLELGYFLHPSCWGTGVFKEAAQLVRDFSFTALRTQRIEMRVSVENPRGNAALHKIGAHLEGRLRAAFVEDGRYIDQYLWSIINHDSEPPRSRPTGRSGSTAE